MPVCAADILGREGLRRIDAVAWHTWRLRHSQVDGDLAAIGADDVQDAWTCAGMRDACVVSQLDIEVPGRRLFNGPARIGFSRAVLPRKQLRHASQSVPAVDNATRQLRSQASLRDRLRPPIPYEHSSACRSQSCARSTWVTPQSGRDRVRRPAAGCRRAIVSPVMAIFIEHVCAGSLPDRTLSARCLLGVVPGAAIRLPTTLSFAVAQSMSTRIRSGRCLKPERQG